MGFRGRRNGRSERRGPAMLRQLRPCFGASVVRRSDLLTSNTADLSARKGVDANGHGGRGRHGCGRALGIGRPRIARELGCVSERTIDENGSHSWSCCPTFRRTRLGRQQPLPLRGVFVFCGSHCRNVRHTRGVDVGDDAHGLLRFCFCTLSELQDLSLLTPIRKGAHLIHGRPQRRSVRPGLTSAPIRRRWAHISGRQGGAVNPAKDPADESTKSIGFGGGDPGPAQAPRRIEDERRRAAAGNGCFAPRARPLAKSGEVRRS